MAQMPATQPATTRAPTEVQFAPLAKVTRVGDLWTNEQFRQIIARAVPKHMTADRLIGTFGVAVQRTPKLAQCSIPSLIGAFVACTAMGLEPNTALQHAYLIPFEVRKKIGGQWQTVRTDVQLIVGYRGYLALAYRSGYVKSIHCDVVWHGDEFSYEYGSEQHLRHKRGEDPSKRGEMPRFVYMHAQLQDGGEVFEVMTLAEILAARERSQGYGIAKKAYDEAIASGRDPRTDKRYSDAPWVRDFVAMARKTVLRAGQKWIPQSVEMASAEMMDENRASFDPNRDAPAVLEGTWQPLPAEFDEDEDYGDTPEPPSIAPPPPTAAQPPPAPKRNAAPQPPHQPSPTEQPRTQQSPAPQKSASPPSRQPEPDISPPTDRWDEPIDAAQPELTPFSAFVYDGQGEPTSDPHTSPVSWARAYAFIASTLNHDEWQAFVEHNADGYTAAFEASAAAADILNTVSEPMVAETDAKEWTPIDVPVVRGVKSWPTFMQEVGSAVANLTDRTLTEWAEHHIPLLRDAPTTTRLKFVSLVNDRALTLAIGVPPALRSLVPAANHAPKATTELSATETGEMSFESTQPDPIEILAQDILSGFQEQTTRDALKMYSRNAAIGAMARRIKEAGRTDLMQKIEAAYKDREHELS